LPDLRGLLTELACFRQAGPGDHYPARRSPNSLTGRPRAAATQRGVLVATSVWKFSTFSSSVSMSCASSSQAYRMWFV
jgi:hypothetical protein